MTDLDFIDSFTAGRLAPEGFDHRAHLRAACLLLRSHPFLEACMAMRDGLRVLAGKLGKPDLYHETVTVAFMALCERGLLDSWYSSMLLASDTARKTFSMPDRIGGRHG
jgi:hypothetical protein